MKGSLLGRAANRPIYLLGRGRTRMSQSEYVGSTPGNELSLEGTFIRKNTLSG